MRKAIIQSIAPAASTLGLLILTGSWELAEAKPVNCERKQIECQKRCRDRYPESDPAASKRSIATSGLATSSLQIVSARSLPPKEATAVGIILTLTRGPRALEAGTTPTRDHGPRA